MKHYTENETFNGNKATEDFIIDHISKGDKKVKISMDELNTIFRNGALSQNVYNKSRSIFVINKRAEGLTYGEIGELLGLSQERV